jgi:Xaa-Pro aminopeptidase
MTAAAAFGGGDFGSLGGGFAGGIVGGVAVPRAARAPAGADATGRGGRAADRAGGAAQQRQRLPVPPRQLLLLPDRLHRAGQRAGAGGPARGSDAPAAPILFCRQKNLEREIWDGFRHGPDGARAAFGFDEAHADRRPRRRDSQLLADAPACTTRWRRHPLDAQVRLWLGNVRRMARTGVTAPAAAIDLLPLLDEMRLLKDDGEQATMLRAATISSQAHVRAMRAAKPGVHEYELEAELLYEFRRNGAQAPAYNSIVAAGANACVLHYSANNAQSRDGDLILIDAGCELDGYASDITRTFPVNGRFSAPQRRLYELVLAAQSAALKAIAPGLPYSGAHEAAVQVLAQGMLDLGLLDRNTTAAWPTSSPTSATCSSTCTAPATGWAWTCTTSASTATSPPRASRRARCGPAWW